MKRNALSELLKLPSVQARIDMIAEDLHRPPGQRRFQRADMWELAETVLELQLDGPNSLSVPVYSRITLDESEEDYPAQAHLHVLEGKVSEERFRLLARQAQKIDAGLRTEDLRITARERRLIEDWMNENAEPDAFSDFVLYQVNHFDLTASDGTEVCFRVIQGDGGELSDLIGPYQIHDGTAPEDPDVRYGDGF